MRWLAVACAAVCCPPAAGLVAPARTITYSTRDDFVLRWNTWQIAKELGVSLCQLKSTQPDKPFTDAAEAANRRRVALGLAPLYCVPLPPLSSSECFVRNSADIASAGLRVSWRAFQLACCDVRGTISALMAHDNWPALMATGQLTLSGSFQQIGPCDHKIGLPDESRATLEVLAALPVSEYNKREHLNRDCEAARALWYRLKEEGHRLQNEGKLRGAEKAFERAERAKAAYASLRLESCTQFLDDISRAGWAGEYYAGPIKCMDAAMQQMRIDCTELREQGKEQAAVETNARIQQVKAQRDSLYKELHMAMRSPYIDGDAYLCAEKDCDAGLPDGTTYSLERAMASPPATRGRDD